MFQVNQFFISKFKHNVDKFKLIIVNIVLLNELDHQDHNYKKFESSLIVKILSKRYI